jgi:hypothetical protein
MITSFFIPQNYGKIVERGYVVPISLRNRSTMMACPPPLMESEQKFSEALGTVDNFKITGDNMQLRQGDTVLAEFEAVYLK